MLLRSLSWTRISTATLRYLRLHHRYHAALAELGHSDVCRAGYERHPSQEANPRLFSLMGTYYSRGRLKKESYTGCANIRNCLRFYGTLLNVCMTESKSSVCHASLAALCWSISTIGVPVACCGTGGRCCF